MNLRWTKDSQARLDRLREVDPEEELDPALLAALARSDEQVARGEIVPADVVLAEVDAILFGTPR